MVWAVPRWRGPRRNGIHAAMSAWRLGFSAARTCPHLRDVLASAVSRAARYSYLWATYGLPETVADSLPPARLAWGGGAQSASRWVEQRPALEPEQSHHRPGGASPIPGRYFKC